jgi:uncharacterized protein (DUF2062 family)
MTIRQSAGEWLVQGITPRRLAFTLALGFVLGFIPLLGVPTGLCVLAALAFRLNQPAIQVANYAAMPFQLALVVPFVRLGGKLTPWLTRQGVDMAMLTSSPWQMLQHSSTQVATQLGIMAGQAMLAWMLVAIPMTLVLTFMLTGVLRRVPVMADRQR